MASVLDRVAVRLLLFAAFWLAVWLFQWWVAPNWLVATRAGLATLLQVLPGTIVALFALIFASVYVLGQQAANMYGSRAVTVLTFDARVLSLLARSLTLAVIPLLLAGQVPDEGDPCDAVTSAAATIALATAALIPSTAATLFGLLGVYTAPRSFALSTVELSSDSLERGGTAFAVITTRVLGEMLRAGIRRGDAPAVTSALEGLEAIQAAYVEAAQRHPSVRTHVTDGTAVEGWLGVELRETLARAGEEAMRSASVEQDTDAIAQTLERVTTTAIRAGHETDAVSLIEALTRLGVSSHQVRPETVNMWPQSADALARAEAAAEQARSKDLAAKALAAWAFVVAYPVYHFGAPHPAYHDSASRLGDDPPWRDARDEIESPDFQQAWRNKLYGHTDILLEVLRLAAELRGVQLQDWPELQAEDDN